MRRGKKNCSKIKPYLLLLFLGGFFIWPASVFSVASEVVINEIAWMGTKNSVADEWIELFNNTEQEIDLSDWSLRAMDGSPKIILEGIISPSGYFLLERTDDNSVPQIAADQIYTGALSNAGENLELRDKANNLVDLINNAEGWLAGDNSTKQTMERTKTGWQTSSDIGGTPKKQNSLGTGSSKEPQFKKTKEEQKTDTSTGIPISINQPPVAKAGSDIAALTNQEILFNGSQSFDPDNNDLTFFWNFGDGTTDNQKETSHIYPYPGQYIVSLAVSDGELLDIDIIIVNIYNQSIIISEFLPNPRGKDQENEWIELFNQSDQIANLTGWQLDDQKGGSRPFVFPKNSFIGPKQFLVLKRATTKIALNNNNDQVRLIYPDNYPAVEISYLIEDGNKEGLSVAFNNSDYLWTKIPTPGSANIISAARIEKEPKEVLNINPRPVIEETLKLTEVSPTNINQDQSLDALNALLRPASDTIAVQASQTSRIDQTKQETIQLPLQESAAAVKLTQTNQKANLILTLSIIVSVSILVSWLLILFKKYHQ
jgi:PKD repeat protein